MAGITMSPAKVMTEFAGDGVFTGTVSLQVLIHDRSAATVFMSI